MKTINFTVKDPQGMHARPAGALVKEAKKFESSVTVKTDGKEADAKKILAVMSLGVKCGQEIELIIDGSDEAAAAEAITEFLENNL